MLVGKYFIEAGGGTPLQLEDAQSLSQTLPREGGGEQSLYICMRRLWEGDSGKRKGCWQLPGKALQFQ